MVAHSRNCFLLLSNLLRPNWSRLEKPMSKWFLIYAAFLDWADWFVWIFMVVDRWIWYFALWDNRKIKLYKMQEYDWHAVKLVRCNNNTFTLSLSPSLCLFLSFHLRCPSCFFHLFSLSPSFSSPTLTLSLSLASSASSYTASCALFRLYTFYLRSLFVFIIYWIIILSIIWLFCYSYGFRRSNEFLAFLSMHFIY